MSDVTQRDIAKINGWVFFNFVYPVHVRLFFGNPDGICKFLAALN